MTVELEQTGRQTQKVQLHRTETGRGRFEAVLNNLPAGGYHAKMIAPALPGRVSAADFVVDPPQSELARVQIDAEEMKQAAEVDQGRLLYLQGRFRACSSDLPDGRQVPVESLPPRAALEPLAAAGFVAGIADRGMAAAEAEGDGVAG